MENNNFCVLKRKASALINIISNGRDVLGVNGWQMLDSNGEYGSTHVIEQESKIPYRFRDKYFVNQTTCMKQAINSYTQNQEVEDLSNTWQNC